jgi:hypothetical protein
VYEWLGQLGFVKPNPDYDSSVEWTPERKAAGNKQILRWYWTEKGKQYTFSMDESELTTNPSGSSNGRKAKAEKTVTAKRYKVDKVGQSVGNR